MRTTKEEKEDKKQCCGSETIFSDPDPDPDPDPTWRVISDPDPEPALGSFRIRNRILD